MSGRGRIRLTLLGMWRNVRGFVRQLRYPDPRISRVPPSEDSPELMRAQQRGLRSFGHKLSRLQRWQHAQRRRRGGSWTEIADAEDPPDS